ncbi:IclR family transcriptional regulator [Streptomyces olivaceus]|nr:MULTISPECIES: IclR family transcriptional regulator [Streptomyces]MBF8171019.1 IclR family transcriptional regulator [Streptomyces olivaceus]MBZ6247316.1 IclR family transcriptional regulator [Streptomyces olivaceus]MCM8549892.1 IclR family transcriptional regulator [Streptomyces sp. STCH 565 A]
MSSEPGERSTASARSDREVTSVANAMRLIEALGRQPSGGVSDLARELGLSKPAVDRLLSTLMSSGYVERDTDSPRYRLTMKLVAIANSVKDRTGLIEVARPRLAELAEAFHETVNLGTLHQGSIVYALTVPSQRLFRIEPVPGSEVPAYATALGKAVLAHSPDDVRDRYLSEFRPIPFTRFTTASAADLRQRLERARRDGYALDDGELVEEVCCAAAPVLDTDGHAVAAVSVTTIRSTFSKSGDQITRAVIETARAISESMVTFR